MNIENNEKLNPDENESGSQKMKRRSQIEMRRQIWDLRQKFWTYEAIGRELGITLQTVEQTMRYITRDYAKRHAEDVDRVKAEQVAEHEHIAFEAYTAWENSKKSYLQTKKKYVVISGLTSPAIEHNETPIVNHGDPRYLDMVMKAKEAIRKIVGADAPMKIDARYADMDKLSDDELRKLALGEIESNAAHGADETGGEETAEGK